MVHGDAVTAAPGVKAAGEVCVGLLRVNGDELPGYAVEDVSALDAAVELVADAADADGGGGHAGRVCGKVRRVGQGRGIAEVGDSGRGVDAGDGGAD